MQKRMTRKTKMLAGAFLALGLAATGVGFASAATTPTGKNPMSSLVTAIAQKFNLSPNDVQQVFDDQRAQMQADMKAKMAARLAQAVADGKMTQAQADKITAGGFGRMGPGFSRNFR